MITYSHSRINTFENCPLQYKFNYIEKIKRDEESIEAFVGSRFHEVMEKLYQDLRFRVYTLVSRQTCNVVNNVVYFLHNQIRRIGYEEIHCDTYRRRTRSFWRTHFQGRAQITKDTRRADSAWVR